MLKIGTFYDSNNYGKVKILSKHYRTEFYNVQFLETGTVKAFRESCIKKGCIRDPYAKAVCGVACTGDIKTKGKYKAYYAVWHDMINRCYNPKNKRYNAYKDVTVDESWLIFENFYNDAPEIDGFDDELIQKGELVLDKDIKQRFSSNKVYSKDMCMWVDKHTNNDIQDGQQKEFVAISPTGEVYRDYNITRFARTHNLRRRHISGVLHKRAKTARGWKFYYEEIV